MLTSFKKIENLGVFAKYAPDNDLPEFQRYNVVYGDNGSGKTTLSRLLASLPVGQHSDYVDLKYAVQSQSGAFSQGQSYPRKIRVFNADYIEANVGQCEGHIPHILIVGEDNKALALEIDAEQDAYDARSIDVETTTAAIAKLEAERGKLFSAIAKTIGEATSGATLRSYRKPEAEAAYAKLTAFKELDPADLTIHRSTVNQEQLEAVERLEMPVQLYADGPSRDLMSLLNALPSEIDGLTQRTAQSAVISRLVEFGDLAMWAERGLELHREHKSERCEFCDQALPLARMKALAEHFSDEDQAFRSEIELAQRAVDYRRQNIESMTCPARSEFYSELREEADAAGTALAAAKMKALSFVSAADDALTRKLTLRTIPYPFAVAAELADLETATLKVQAVCDRHNQKSAAFEAEKEKARDAIESSHLSSISAQVQAVDNEIEQAKARLVALDAGTSGPFAGQSLSALAASIKTKRAKVANAHTAGEDMTRRLQNFLGRSELTFEAADEGYLVRRRGEPAKRLSEGEKTAIAFIYFIVQLRDDAFDLTEGVVVIDDPISSLDSSAIYQAFSYLKNAVKDAKQVIVLTHNFDFLKLVLNWFHGIPKKVGLKAYFMIVCGETATGRNAQLCKLDQLLQQHSSEYQYLFKTLFNYKSDGTIQSAYHIPNVARKVLETFLEFYQPSADNLHDKLEALDFDPLKKTAIYKFANDLSHMTGKGFDPALVAETQKNAGYLLEMIADLAPKHYAGLVKLSA